jgi:uncharacterized protein YecE (DUF72 family)
MKLYAGTSGFSYKGWKGHFYPEKMKNEEMLAFYATKLPTVEINNTFYKMPRSSMLEGWMEQVPSKFRFVLKATRRITHNKRLKNVESELGYLSEATATLGKQLGVTFFQLPPNFKKDMERLSPFLESLEKGATHAFEFRHESWFDDEVYAALKKHNCAMCLADTEDDFEVPLVSTAKWGYLRLRKPSYRKPEMEKWLKWINEQKWKNAYVFFKHEDEGAGPKMATRFLDLAGQ